MTTLLIADDHRIVTDGLTKIINENADTQVLGVASTLAELTELLPNLRPDVLLLDVALPDGDGIDAIPRLRQLQPGLRISVLTMFAETSVIHRALHNDANGYLFKGAGADELLGAINAVASGEQFLCDEARHILCEEKETPATLTMREREILTLLADGCTMKDIADRLCLAFETVHSYTKNLRQKMGCNNTASLVRTAIERHLI